MKLVFFAAALPAVVALQNGYLSQLNTGTYEGVNSGKVPGGFFFPDPAETTKSVYVQKPPSAREIPDGHVSLLNRGTYEGVNGGGFGGGAFFPDPAETPKSVYATKRPNVRETPDGHVSLLNRGTYEGINGGKAPGGDFFFPDPAETTTRDLYSPAPTRGATYARYQPKAVPPPVETPVFHHHQQQQLPYAAPAAPAAPAPATTTTTTTAVPSYELLELWGNQVSVELAASQLYLSASIWFRVRNMDGMAAWMLDESDEERGHGLAILEFAMKSKFPVHLKALDAPKADWQTPTQVWESILNAERTNTQNLLKLSSVANQCGLYGAMAFLDPFNVEQLEAEDKVGGILAKVRIGTPELLMELDHKLGLEAEEEEHH